MNPSEGAPGGESLSPPVRPPDEGRKATMPIMKINFTDDDVALLTATISGVQASTKDKTTAADLRRILKKVFTAWRKAK